MGFVSQGAGLMWIERKGVPEGVGRTSHLETGENPLWFWYHE